MGGNKVSIDLQRAYIDTRVNSIIKHLEHDRADMSYTRSDKEKIDIDIRFMKLVRHYLKEEEYESNLH